MPHIRQLDPHVADLIAAGEVVERPASVVKELMENAIDAGAACVTVEVQHGGMTLIRVTDDGCGIAAGEAATAFLRHATSKLRSEYDLEAIGTLGFRGEALAAIAAVSRIGLLTRTREEPLGVSLSLEGGAVISRDEAGCPAGTTLVVRDLFYNTPARLKFMKKDAAEGAACFAMAQRVALSHPEVSVRFLRDGKQELLTPGDAQLKSAVYAVLGRDMALGLVDVSGSGEEMSVSGFASLPACCRGTRGYQHFFVNGRYVKSRTMMAALEEAYANQKMVGKFPGCVLHLTARLNTVDVNVHPTKQEVKFGSDKRVFDAVYYAVRSALEADRTRPAAVADAPRVAPAAGHDTVTPNQTAFRSMSARDYRQGGAPVLPLRDYTAQRGSGGLTAPGRRGAFPPDGPGPDAPAPPGALPGDGAQAPPPAAPSLPARPAPPSAGDAGRARDEASAFRRDAPAAEIRAAGRPAAEDAPPPPSAAALAREVPVPEPEPWRMAGEVLNTYIVVEQGDRVLFIDKHAAHERMNFDRMKAEGYRPLVQALLTPVVFTPPAEEGAALLSQLPLLRRFGFEAEDFGGGAVLVRAAPDGVAAGEIEAALTELAGRLLSTGRADPDAARDALLHTLACKAAIKGGQRNGPEELLRVAGAVLSGQVRYCPHGRPVAIELTRAQLERRFGRA